MSEAAHILHIHVLQHVVPDKMERWSQGRREGKDDRTVPGREADGLRESGRESERETLLCANFTTR